MLPGNRSQAIASRWFSPLMQGLWHELATIRMADSAPCAQIAAHAMLETPVVELAVSGIPKTLEDALRDRLIIPFIGAGVSRAVTRKDRPGTAVFPSWSELLELAATRLRDDGKIPESQLVQGLLHKRTPDYLQAARYAREGLGPVWYRLLIDTFDPGFAEIDEVSLGLARAVWKLPSRLVITTNYDQVLRWAFHSPNDLAELNIEHTAELSAMLRDRIDRPTVWHLHGQIHNAQKLILTPDGYSELYPERAEEQRYQAALTSLRHLLATRTFLFIGFSLDDERFGDQIRWVNNTFQGTAGPHYLLVRERNVREAQRRLERLENIEFLPFTEYGQTLIDRIEQLAAVASGPLGMPRQEPQELSRVVAMTHDGGTLQHPPSAAPAGAQPRSVDAPKIKLGLASPPLAPAERDAPLSLVRHSFRQVYSYQRRVFDRLTELSDALASLGIEFDRWDPSYNSRPARSSSEFFRRNYWAWDFMPGYHLTLMWQSLAGQGTTVRGVVVMVETDTGFKKPGERSEPDPVQFAPVEECHSLLRIDLYRLTDLTANWNQAWPLLAQMPDHRNGCDHVIKLGTGEATYRYLSVDIKDVLEQEGLTVHVITPLKAWFADVV